VVYYYQADMWQLVQTSRTNIFHLLGCFVHSSVPVDQSLLVSVSKKAAENTVHRTAGHVNDFFAEVPPPEAKVARK
jgi:hypothetical protein